MTEQILKQVDLEKFTAKLIEPGLVENYIKPGMHMEPRDAWELKKINQDMNEGNPYGVLIVSGHLSSVSKEAREIVASREFVGQTAQKRCWLIPWDTASLATSTYPLTSPLSKPAFLQIAQRPSNG